MTNVFVNAVSSSSAGGHSVLTSFLRAAATADDEFSYLVAVTDSARYKEFQCNRIQFLSLGYWCAGKMLPFTSAILIPMLAAHARAQIVFNLGDIPIRTGLCQVFLLDWSFAVYPRSQAWNMGSSLERFRCRAKIWFFRKWLKFINAFIVQSENMAERLQSQYSVENISIVPTPTISAGESARVDFTTLPVGFKFLCLNRFYPHKNLEVLLPVAELIKNSGDEIFIITTIDPSDGDGAKEFLARVKDYGFDGVIINLGTIPHESTPSLFRAADAMFSPTLLESYGISYVEAMIYRKPIVTSDLDFAHAVCKDAALYIDPHDAYDIFKALRRIKHDPMLRATLVHEGQSALEAIPDGQGAYDEYTDLFRKLLKVCSG